MNGFAEVLQQIARENDARRARTPDGGDVAWTWEQWDRFIAAGEKYGVPGYAQQAFWKTKQRVATAKSDGLSAWQFHIALKHVVVHYAPKIDVPTASEQDPKYRAMVNDAVLREKARAEAREIVGRSGRRKPQPVEV